MYCVCRESDALSELRKGGVSCKPSVGDRVCSDFPAAKMRGGLGIWERRSTYVHLFTEATA